LLKPVTDVAGIGSSIAVRLHKKGVDCLGDFLLQLPKNYVDDRTPVQLSQLEEGVVSRTQGHVLRRSSKGFGKRKVVQLLLADETGSELVLRFFHSPYLDRDARVAEGQWISVRGLVENWHGQKQMLHPTWLPLSQFQASYRPEYAVVAGLSSTRIQQFIRRIFELLPQEAESPLDVLGDLSLYDAFHRLHLPQLDHPRMYPIAKKRLILEELWIHLALMKQQHRQAMCGTSVLTAAQYTKQLLLHFPWQLTSAQQQVWKDIQKDLGRGQRMHRLLQGDVGAGKTCVAALSIACVCDHGLQAALMVPTEVLAQQHVKCLTTWFEPLGLIVGLLTSSLKKAERRKILQQLQLGELHILVGTHALISEDVQFHQLGLAIVDEQHRFGVKQRWALTEKGRGVHLLAMTATPIPRSLALSLYGDMDLSVMHGMPSGRKPIITTLLNHRQLPKLAQGMERIVKDKGLIYWIVPRIDDENDGISVKQRQQELQQRFPKWVILTLHGRMKNEEKTKVLAQFSRGDAQILVSTTVVEVGVHIEDGRLMVIDDAHQYGLAQLHQLRGRVGRSDVQSYCVLIAGKDTSSAGLDRLKQLCHRHDGLELAEVDLEKRGMGDALGVRQSGDMSFRLLDPVRDAQLIQQQAASLPNFTLTTEMMSFWKEMLSISG